MKYIGLVLITIGFALLVLVGYNLLMEKNRIKTPVPEEKGVRVIFVTPTK